ncbi:hypothetical protein KQI42_03895 [Tissierella sp. MSJ-40]|uniref:Uncharacterized protein n=1 Tax=Tissierella simiarum TaxID=2841534 RepID=A0ABS6E4F0_9FIRM|nr:hypothetical protein [Tissierella simiarum]MBU5437138.1 hypothetical protein [Tissierella simiarum]
MVNNIINIVQNLIQQDDKFKIIDILRNFISNEDTNNIMDIGWAYWNISDNYAMLRMADEEFKNHIKFAEFINKELPKEMLYWTVSDGTQKQTLILGGYEKFWYDLYITACNTAPKTNDNFRIRFESHRAAISLIGSKLGEPNIEMSEFALNNIKDLINENPTDYNMRFYTITYYSLLLVINTYLNRSQSEALDKAMESFNALVPYLDMDNEKENYDEIVGTWEQLNSKRSKYNQAMVGINNLIMNLIDIFQYKMALECYKIFEEKRISTNDYFKSRIEHAKSNV